jgi:predicted transposase YbfD/YdcC
MDARPAPEAAMPDPAPPDLLGHFADLPDPRVERGRRHRLLDIVTVAVCAVICGADSWVDVELFGDSKLEWFRTFLELPGGIPSHDTFGRVFARLDPARFEGCFLGWVRALVAQTGGGLVSLDGKTLRRSHDRAAGLGPLQMVSAWADANRLVLGQVAVGPDSNEITALPALLQALALDGCVVTIDAIGCQTEIVRTIVDGRGDYVLAAKGNQPTLQADIAAHFAELAEGRPAPAGRAEPDALRTVDNDHGRLEIRRYRVSADPAFLAYLNAGGRWAKLTSVGMVERERRHGGKVERETTYYISSLPPDARAFARAARGHWGIENRLHWVLDIAFREDDSRVRTGHAQENFAVLRHIALNLLRRDKSTKAGVKAKRLKAGWDAQYLRQLLYS